MAVDGLVDLEVAAEGEVECYAIVEAQAADVGQRAAGIDGALLGDEHGENVTEPLTEIGAGLGVGFSGKAGGLDERFLAAAQKMFGLERILDLTERVEHRLLEDGEGFGFLRFAFGQFGFHETAGQDWQGEIRADAPDTKVAVEEFAEGRGAGAAAAGQTQARPQRAARFYMTLLMCCEACL
jgi:hypothetical protein